MKIVYPKNTLLLIFVLLIIPLTNLTLSSGFIGKIKLPEYILDFIKSNSVLNIVYMVVMLILYILVIRWIFSVHEMTLNTGGFKEARKISSRVTKGKTIHIFFYSVAVFLMSIVLGWIIYYSIIILIGLWTKNYTYHGNLREVFISRCIMFKDYSLLISTIAGFIINLGFISAMYYEYNNINFYNYTTQKKKNSIFKTTNKVIVILLLVQIESLAFSTHNNGLFNIEFFYNTTATAHRGDSITAPENTLAAFEEAIISQA